MGYLLASTHERLLDRIAPLRPPVHTDEESVTGRPLLHVFHHRRTQMRRNRDVAHPGSCLRRFVELASTLQQLDPIPTNAYHIRDQIDIRGCERTHLTTPKTTPGREQHSSPISRGDGVHQFDDLGWRRDRAFLRHVLARTANLARVHRDRAIADRAQFMTVRTKR